MARCHRLRSPAMPQCSDFVHGSSLHESVEPAATARWILELVLQHQALLVEPLEELSPTDRPRFAVRASRPYLREPDHATRTVSVLDHGRVSTARLGPKPNDAVIPRAPQIPMLLSVRLDRRRRFRRSIG